MEYEIGQVLYICNQKNLSIVPVLVVEKIFKKTLEDEKTIFSVRFPDKEKTIVALEKLPGKVFTSIEAVKSFMFENTKDAIEKIATNAVKVEEKYFEKYKAAIGQKNVSADVQNDKKVQVEKNNDIIMVDLGGGVKAKASSNILKQVINK